MTTSAIDYPDHLRLDWPEPLLIDLIAECYGGTPDLADRLTAARLHNRFLHDLFESDIRSAAALRVELIACSVARGITPDAIEAADQAAFLELMKVIRARFRNSPRLCLHFMQRLHIALGRLPKKAERKPPIPRKRPLWAMTRPKVLSRTV